VGLAPPNAGMPLTIDIIVIPNMERKGFLVGVGRDRAMPYLYRWMPDQVGHDRVISGIINKPVTHSLLWGF